MRADTLHLTLAFLGDTPEPMRARLLEAITTIPIGPLALRFEGAGYWAHNRIGWLRPQPDARLNALAVALREQLRVLAVPFDARAFVPHVTLLRHTAGGAPPVCAPVRWRADDFVLVESRPDDGGAHYTVLKRWALC